MKRDILWRVYLCFLGIVAFSLVILGRALYIQQVQGSYWKEEAKKQQQRYIEVDADRGTIFSEDGRMLSTSIPYFDVYVDFSADGLREKNGKRFHENLDSLALSFAATFQDKTAAAYKRELQTAYNSGNRYYLLKRNISFQQYKSMRAFPLVRLGKNKSGFIWDVKSKRLNPFGLLANRTIGLSREFIDSDGKIKNSNVGLENTYDTVLRGQSGKRLVRYIAGGVYVPVEGYEIEAEQGKDIVTSLDVNIQDVTEQALLRMMDSNQCEHGTAIVMEVKTGKIKAIANLGRDANGQYWEDLNYAIRASEPGSTFKLATMLSLLEDRHVTLNDRINLEHGVWQVSRRTVYDSEKHEDGGDVTVKKAFELSSNVGMAKLVYNYYTRNPYQYIEHLKKLRLHQTSGIDLVGETQPIIKTPRSKTWSATTLPWMAFGYEVLVSPLQTLMLYNAVANDGRMMKPYLVTEISQHGAPVTSNQPVVLNESICSPSTLQQLRECLLGVCNDSGGTAFKLFKGSAYRVAGKTGTALVANGKRGYADHIYQSSFAGYFPAANPRYSCIVVIKNKPFAKVFYGAAVAGPVFKEIADRLYAMNGDPSQPPASVTADSSSYLYAGYSADMKRVLADLNLNYRDSADTASYDLLTADKTKPVLKGLPPLAAAMPDVTGMGLKDVLYLLENRKLKVQIKGRGKVTAQSIAAGRPLAGGETVVVQLN